MNQEKLSCLLYHEESPFRRLDATKLTEISEYLDRVATSHIKEVHDTNMGICAVVKRVFSVVLPSSKFLGDMLYSDFLGYSGNPVCPIRSSSGFSSHAAFHILPRWKGNYGRLRRELALYLSRVFAELAELRRNEPPIEFNPQTW